MTKDSLPANLAKNSRAQESSNQLQESDIILEPPREFIWRCLFENDVEGFVQRLNNEQEPSHELVMETLKKRNDDGRLPLDVAVLLDRAALIEELITRGCDVNSMSEKGYTSLHLGAIWGKLDSLKLLVKRGADLQIKTTNGERARELALRYNQITCVEYLDYAEAKQQLLQTVQSMKLTLADPEKVQGRLTRDEKKTTDALCNEKLAWIDNTPEATKEDYVNTKNIFDEAVAHIITKLNEPLPEKPEKK